MRPKKVKRQKRNASETSAISTRVERFFRHEAWSSSSDEEDQSVPGDRKKSEIESDIEDTLDATKMASSSTKLCLRSIDANLEKREAEFTHFIKRTEIDTKKYFEHFVNTKYMMTPQERIFRYAPTLDLVDGDGPKIPNDNTRLGHVVIDDVIKNVCFRAINALKYDAVGEFAFSCGSDGKVRKYCMNNKVVTQASRISLLGIDAFELIFNGRLVLACGNDRNLYLYDLKRGHLIQRVRAHNHVITCMCSSASYVFTGSTDKTTKFWSVRKTYDNGPSSFALGSDSNIRYQIHQAKAYILNSAITCICASDSAKRVIMGTRIGVLDIWDTESNNPVSARTIHRNAVTVVSLGLNDKYVITTGEDYKIFMFELEFGNQVMAINVEIIMTAAVWDGVTLIAGTEDGELIVVDIWTDKVLKTLDAHSGRVTALLATNHGELMSACDQGNCLLWRPSGGRHQQSPTYDVQVVPVMQQHPDKLFQKFG
ncbi:hypothetical protein CAPTEDRAFT_190209 [Capitella teleta]|uniref:Uncharacterized protein n=1 Tax=Capitella teleta TaxID=283909 RepID=R7V0W8_CAPTE|nr:hypothetical protein CAPTEDRAFT_190209 [Capitella teleta]|eukprot:ELU09341.1 hypothetical protein CAPTEDRAFT_190209 [Capitella teleta]